MPSMNASGKDKGKITLHNNEQLGIEPGYYCYYHYYPPITSPASTGA